MCEKVVAMSSYNKCRFLPHWFLNCCQNFSSWLAFRSFFHISSVILSSAKNIIFHSNLAGCALLPQNLTAIFHMVTKFLFPQHLSELITRVERQCMGVKLIPISLLVFLCLGA